MEQLVKNFTEAELDQAEQIEKEAGEAADEGWSEQTAVAFVRGAMVLKKKYPDMKIVNLFDVCIQQGMASILRLTLERPRNKTKTRAKLSGAGL